LITINHQFNNIEKTIHQKHSIVYIPLLQLKINLASIESKVL